MKALKKHVWLYQIVDANGTCAAIPKFPGYQACSEYAEKVLYGSSDQRYQEI